ncbi:MAG: hypothetical protein RR555_09765 [Bacteroidales bacterium]
MKKSITSLKTISLCTIMISLVFFSISCNKDKEIDILPTLEDSVAVISLTYNNFKNANDVLVQGPDSSLIIINPQLLEGPKNNSDKSDLTIKRGNVLAIWTGISNLPFYKRVESIEYENNKLLVKVSPATVAEAIVNMDVKLDTHPYYNQSPSVAAQSLSNSIGSSPYLMDDDGYLHPTVIMAPKDNVYYKDSDELYPFVEDKTGYSNLNDSQVIFNMLEYGDHMGNCDFKIGFSKDIDIDFLNDGAFKMGLKGSVGGYIGSRIILETSWFKIKSYETSFVGGYNTNLNLKLGVSGKKEFGDTKYKQLAPIGTYHAIFTIGPVPIYITIEAELARKVSATVSGFLGLVIPVQVSGDFVCGVKYYQGKWGPVTGFTHKETSPSFDNTGFKAEAGLSAEAGIYIKAGVYLAGVAGPYCAIGPQISADAKASLTNFKFLKASVSAKAALMSSVGAELKLLWWKLADYHVDFTLFEYEFIKKEWEVLLGKTVTSNEQVTIPYRLPEYSN